MTPNAAQPLITVVIPAFNAERFLLATLESVSAQTHSNLQIIVVDDGSTDDTAALVTRYSGMDSRVELFSKPNAGQSAARNDGIRNAKGDYVAFVDADDLWHPNKLELQLRALREHPDPNRVGAVYTLSRQIDENGRWIYDYPRFTVQGRILHRHLLTNFISTGGSCLLCPKHVALEVGGFNSDYQPAGAGLCEDYDFQLKIAGTYEIIAVEQYLMGYRRHPGSDSHDHMRMARSRRAVIQHHLDVHRIGGPCQRWALGGVDVVECGAYLATGKPLPALLSAFRLAVRDPVRLLWELFVRLPGSTVQRLFARGPLTGPAFADLAPNEASPAKFPTLLLTRFRRLGALRP